MNAKTIIVIVGILSCGGCATQEERAQRAVDRFGPYCQTLGYTPHTDAWRQCIQSRVSDLYR